MQIDLSSILRPAPAPKLPKWMRGNGVALIRRGSEIWWGTPYFIVRGMPPKGLYLLDQDIVQLDADFGPEGTPEQVEPYVRTEVGTVLLCNQFGETKVAVDRRHLRCIQVTHGDNHLRLFYYPDIVEGESQMIAAFEEGYEQRVTNGMDINSPFAVIEEKAVMVPFAFVTPIIPRPSYFLTIEERAEMIPAFKGGEVFRKGEGNE